VVAYIALLRSAVKTGFTTGYKHPAATRLNHKPTTHTITRLRFTVSFTLG